MQHPGLDHLGEHLGLRPALRAAHVPALRVHPHLLRVAVLHQEIEIGDRLLRIALAVHEQHRRGGLVDEAARHERQARPVREEFLHRLRAVHRCARRVDVEEIFARRERLLLPLGCVVVVDADAVDHGAANAILLRVRKHGRPVAAPASPLHDDALRIDVPARRQVVERGGEHALRADIDEDRRLPGARHVDREHADARVEIAVGSRDHFLLARIEPVYAEDQRHRSRRAWQPQVRDDLLAVERNAHRLDRRIERFPVRLERVERARVGLVLASGEPLAWPASDVEDLPCVEVVAPREVALADATPRRRPVVRLEALQARHRFASILGLDAGKRIQVALGAPQRFLLELFQGARPPALRERGKRQRERDNQPAFHSTSTMHSISTGMPIGSEPMPTAERACLPRSPNTSTKRSEQPLITLG